MPSQGLASNAVCFYEGVLEVIGIEISILEKYSCFAICCVQTAGVVPKACCERHMSFLIS